MKEQSILWRRVDTPGHESACIYGDESGWYLDGSAVFVYDKKPCRLEYLIECDVEWKTTFATIDGWVGEDVVAYEIEVSEDRKWTLKDNKIGAVEGCIDIDLNFSPITNLLPLRRLDISIGESKRVRAAWLRFPSFELEPLEQTYTVLDESMIRYESRNGEFVRELKVNEDGLVLSYPDFWEVEAAIVANS